MPTMNGLKTALGAQPKRQKQVGLLISTAGLAGFFTSMSCFGLFGRQIQYSGKPLLALIVAFSFLVVGLYGAGYAAGGRRTGLSFAKWWAIFLVLLFSIGYLRRVVR